MRGTCFTVGSVAREGSFEGGKGIMMDVSIG